MEEFKQVRENLVDMLEEIDEELKTTGNEQQIAGSEEKDIARPGESRGIFKAFKKIKQAINKIDNGT